MPQPRRAKFQPPLPGLPGMGPLIECVGDLTKAGVPLPPVYEYDWETGMMKLMDPQPVPPYTTTPTTPPSDKPE